LIFFEVPPPLQPVEGGGSVKGKRGIRYEVSFQASYRFRNERRSLDEPESLPNRIHRTLTDYPGTENGRGELQKVTNELNKSKINFSKHAKKKPL